MVYYVNKLSWILLLIVLSSCRRELSSDDLKQMREQAYQVSVSTIGEKEYWNIYRAMNDSVKVWTENELWLYKHFNQDSINYGAKYEIDSLLCFNSTRNMCFTGIFIQALHGDAQMDDIRHFFGIKINSQWYFFSGAAMGLPRDRYQENIHIPLSFEKLKELATKHLYRTYLRKSKNGSWEINEAFFNSYYKYDAYNRPYTTEAERDSSWLRACRENWSQKNKR